MIVCHCKGLSDNAIRRAVREGARDLAAVTRDCLAGVECGGCRASIMDVILEENRNHSLPARFPALASAH